MQEAISAVENSPSFKRKKEFMATERRTRLTLHRRRRAVRATATPFKVFIPGGAHHPIPERRVSMQTYTKLLHRVGYMVKTYHPAPLGASDPTEGVSFCYRNLRYFLPPDNDADYLVKTLNNQTRAS